MSLYKSKMTTLRNALFALGLVAVSGAAMAQSTVSLTAQSTNANLPDGQSVPMWGYFCGTPSGTGVTCTAMNGSTQSTTAWQPPLIRVPAGATLTITLNNQLSFTGTGVPTSIVIDGQVGGGLGGTPARMASPTHAPYGTTWNGTAGDATPADCTNGTGGGASSTFCPPAQSDRVRSFATEVAAGTSNSTLTWSALRPGTYLIHSGTEPSIQHAMGLYGVLVVYEADTGLAPTNSAYGTGFDAEVPLLFSEIDPVQNSAVAAAVATTGFSETATWAGPGACKDGATACYPPAVNYSPRYYLINGTSFDRTQLAASTLTGPGTTGASGNVLVRIVNAGQRLHVPAVVGADMTLLAEDGNKVSGGTRVQSSIPMPPGKTFDAVIKPTQTVAGTYDAATFPVYDRELSLSTNNQRDGGMQAYITVAGGAATGVGTGASGVTLNATDHNYFCVAGTSLSVTEASKGVLGGSVGASGVSAPTAFTNNLSASNLTLHSDGTFTYTQAAGATACGGTFTYLVNGTAAHTATIAQCDVNSSSATGCALGSAPVANDFLVVSSVGSRYASPPPGVLAHVTNASGLSLSAVATAAVNADGSFVATGPGAVACPATFASQVPTGASCVAVPYSVKDAQGQTSAATAYVAFQPGSGLTLTVKDGPSGIALPDDYRWIIEEDQTVAIDPKCQVNATPRPLDSNGKACAPLPVESQGYNFHTASMKVIAQGCVGTVSCEAGQKLQGADTACDIGNGVCRTGVSQKTPTLPGDVHLDANKRYYVSILPGDAINPTISGFGGTAQDCGTFNPTDATNWGLYNPADGSAGNCGHEMGGAQIAPGQLAATINLQQIPLPTAKISVFVFEDDNPLNGENDAGGGVDVIAPNEPGLGGFEVKLFDQAGQLGDNTGQITYDEFNEPVSNSLAGYKDPITGLDACPITARTDGLVGMVPTCPKYESDGVTPSPLAGQVVIANLYPGLYEIQAYPAADRIARGEQWWQTNTLDGGKPHEAFIIPSEPGYFQEFGPGGYHVSIGYANPAIINARKAGYCASTLNTGACNHTLTVEVTNNHMSRTPDQRTFDSGTYDHYAFTQCYVSVGPSDAEDFDIEPCVLTTDADGKTHATATFTGMPAGTFKMSVFDQWNDIMLDGLVGTVEVGSGTTTHKTFPVTQWRTNLYTRTYIDTDGSGISTEDKPGLSLVNTNIRYRDGSIAFFNNTDLNGNAGFNEVFPFMNWLVVDTTQTRYKPTWSHIVYDAGGPVDCTPAGSPILGSAGTPPCSTTAGSLANTAVRVPLPADLRVPGAKYCDTADCLPGDLGTGASSGVLFPPQAFSNSIGWQGLLGQNTFMEFGVKPFKPATATTPAENGGIHGQVVYASTRPFDDPSLLLQLSWEPGVPHATINLYSKTVDALGNEVLKLVDTTQSASWDDWAQGFRKGADGTTLLTAGGGFVPNMNCPGQDATSPFFATLKDSKQWLDPADSAGNKKALAYHSQFKCYDGWSQLNQAQPAPYDGYYSFPSVTAIDPATGKPSKSNCTSCVTNPDDGVSKMLPAGTYVVEVIPPTGFELVKEEDKNILMGDVYVAPVTQQFGQVIGLGNIYILPDQAAVGAAYNASNPGNLNTTTNIGAQPRHEGDTGSVEAFWPCVGAERQVPDFNSEFPGSAQQAPFAGAMRRLCDRKEVKLVDESSTLAKFYLFSSTHIAGHFTGTITNDFASEFDPFSPQFGEKFGPPNLPVGLRDFNGNEVARVYSDQWGIYNGMYFSTWSPNPPNPTGYAPQMSIACMNDPGPIKVGTDTAGQPIMGTDPAYNPAYSNFCYEQPFMPGTTTYMDTPVIPTQSFADGYNLPDTEYPDLTPAVLKVVNSDSSAPQGPWVRAATAPATASANFTISGVASCPNATCSGRGNARTTLSFPGGTVACTNTGTGGPNCSGNNNSRSNAVAAYIRSNIVGLMGAGYTATGTNANVAITAPGSGTSYNGTVVISATTNLGGPSAPVVLSGGADVTTASLGLTITALGDKTVQNPMYTGPNATVAPYNQKTITRHYGFGTGGTATLVAPDGTTTADLTVATGGWTDSQITATVPALPAAFNCKVQQRGAPTAQCGQLVITRADNGKRSFDAITVNVGGSAPWVVTEKAVTAPSGKTVKDYGSKFGRMNLVLGATNQSPIQVAIDSASPGDLILVQPGTYRENLIMWKPVRLQGVGAGSVTVNADAHPAGHMDQWRRQMVCVFGLTLDGIPNIGNNQGKFDPNSQYGCPEEMFLTGDRIPFEAITGWQASGNGNLAQVLQEPTLLGAYEGAGITVVGRGVRAPAGNPFFLGNDPTAAGAFPDGSVYLTDGVNGIGNLRARGDDCVVHTGATATAGGNYGASNYRCNPSRIDGLAILNSSQGGGGVFVHGWAHNLEVANNRISANHGTLAGAVNLGNGETPPVFLNDGTSCGAGVPALCPPIPVGTPNGGTVPFGFNTFVRIHNNMLWNNASIGDALFTGTPAGAGGVTVSAGGDNYSIDNNWIAGNLSTGDGGGVQQLGVNFNGRIAKNVIMFNQSTNPTLPTNGGGVVVQGANEPRTLNGNECGGATDTDCPPGLGDGTGAGLVIDANLIYGNSAESGTGGGIALEMVNGSEVIAFPRQSDNWYGVTLTNNIIANNVAGYDGGGVSLRDTLKATIVNNTIVSNDTTASAGVLFKTLGAANSSSPPPGCNAQTDPTKPQDPSCLGRDAPHGPQPSGLVTMAHTQNLNDAIAGVVPSNNGTTLRCPTGFGYANGVGTANNGMNNADCMKFSRPLLVNDLFWQNRVFHVFIDTVANTGNTGLTSQQNLIGIAPGILTATTPLPAQTAFGSCPAGATYWDIGLRTDDVQAGLISAAANKLAITNSLLTGTAADLGTAAETIASATNVFGDTNTVNAPICNGARTPPEACGLLANGLGQSCHGFNSPPGASESTSTSSLFVFDNIQPTATVDEGHNWLNLTYGPLTLARPGVTGATAGELLLANAATGTAGGAYSIPGTSPAAGAGVAAGTNHDFFGNTRPTTGAVAIGAVEVRALPKPPTLTAINPNSGAQGATNLAVTLTGTNLLGTSAVTVSGGGVTCNVVNPAPTATNVNARCTITAAAATGARTVTVTSPNGTSNGVTFTVTLPPPNPSLNCPATQLTCLLGVASFGSVTNNTTGSSMTFTLSNSGGGFVISSITGVKSPNPAPPLPPNGNGTYDVTGGTCAVGNTIAAGGSCTVIVRFRSPAGISLTVGTLTVSGTAVGGGATVTATRALSGN